MRSVIGLAEPLELGALGGLDLGLERGDVRGLEVVVGLDLLGQLTDLLLGGRVVVVVAGLEEVTNAGQSANWKSSTGPISACSIAYCVA